MQETPTGKTCYEPVAQQVLDSAQTIRLLMCDVNAVMSAGLIYMGNHGEELKAFNVRDGDGILCLLTSGIEVGIITGRSARPVEYRVRHTRHSASLPGTIG